HHCDSHSASVEVSSIVVRCKFNSCGSNRVSARSICTTTVEIILDIIDAFVVRSSSQWNSYNCIALTWIYIHNNVRWASDYRRLVITYVHSEGTSNSIKRCICCCVRDSCCTKVELVSTYITISRSCSSTAHRPCDGWSRAIVGSR